ncbi:MAG: TIGR03617 family F420-dependent LLM class oxidoreductase [Gammaproteobacteria bacterium]|nr:TIGR03617 family F420-dependent LLM class oxidoreductase [Gammaproteobacteria bacterium]
MKVITSIPSEALNKIAGVVETLDLAGFSGISTQENRHNPFLPLAIAATHSSKLELRTSVAIAFARSPMVSAGLAWDLQAASSGRFTLGLGSQVKGHNVRRFGVPWSPPAPRLREYIQAVRAIWDCWHTGTQLDYHGEHYQLSLMTPNFTPEPLECNLPKIQIAAVGPAMMKVAAEQCDGVMLHAFCTARYLKTRIMPRLSQGLDQANRNRDRFEISGGGFVITGKDDAEVEKQFEWVRTRIGFYGSTPAYWPVFKVHDLEDLGLELNEMSKKGQWQDMSRLISDDLVHEFAAVGRFDEIAAKIEQHFNGMVDIVNLPNNTPRELIQDVININTPLQT